MILSQKEERLQVLCLKAFFFLLRLFMVSILFRTEDPVAGIAEAGADIGVLIELTV